MRWLSRLTIGLRAVFRRRRVERELDAELHFHLDEQIAENVAAGMSPEDARRSANLSLGGVTQLKEVVGDQGPWRRRHSARRALRRSVIAPHAGVCPGRRYRARLGDWRERDRVHDREHSAPATVAVRTRRRHCPNQTAHTLW
jgi:hypothetical protein